MTKTTMTSLTIIGRRWFQKTCGNTYHTVEIHIDGELVHKVGRSYGYGQQYSQSAVNWLQENDYLPGLLQYEPLWSYCERNGIKLVDTVTDVTRKRDL